MATYDMSARSFATVERDFYSCIENSSFHVLVNCRDHEGYIGQSAAREVAFAISKQKMVLAVHGDLSFGQEVDGVAREVITANWDAISKLEYRTWAVVLENGLECTSVQYLMRPGQSIYVEEMVERYIAELDE